MTPRARIPGPMRWLILGFFLAAVQGFFRFGQTIAWRELLDQIGMEPGPAYFIASGALFGLLALAAALGLLIFRQRAVLPAGLATALLALGYWAERLFIRSADDLANAPFSLGLTLVALIYTAAVLWWWQRRSRRAESGVQSSPVEQGEVNNGSP